MAMVMAMDTAMDTVTVMDTATVIQRKKLKGTNGRNGCLDNLI